MWKHCTQLSYRLPAPVHAATPSPHYLLQYTCAAAFCPALLSLSDRSEVRPPMLLLGDSCLGGGASPEDHLGLDETCLVAVDPVTRVVRRATPFGAFARVIGVAVLPLHDVAVASSYHGNALHVHSLADGARLASIFTPTPNPASVAADPRTGVIFTATDSGFVYAFHWTGRSREDGLSCADSGLKSTGALELLGKLDLPLDPHSTHGQTLHLAFMAPFPGSGPDAPGHLVVGWHESSNVIVCPVYASASPRVGPQEFASSTLAGSGAVPVGLRSVIDTTKSALMRALPRCNDTHATDSDDSDNFSLVGLASDTLGTILVVASENGLYVFEWPLLVPA